MSAVTRVKHLPSYEEGNYR